MVQAGTRNKEPFFHAPDRLSLVCDALLELAEKYGWALEAWAVLSNHYHFIGTSSKPDALRQLVRHLHSLTAREINRWDEAPGRRVWFQYWDTHLTYHKSYYARLNYVHRNAVHHGLVRTPSEYPWCSAAWFERRAQQSFYRTIMNFPCDSINVRDDYEVSPEGLRSK